MKKFVSFCLATILLIASVCSVSAAKLGDTDNDGMIAITDATNIQMHLAMIITLDDNVMTAADVNGNGIIDILDCTCIQQHIALIIDKFPAEENATEAPTFDISTDSGITPSNPTQAPTQEPTQEPTQAPTEYTQPSEYDLDVLRLVNIEREKVGAQPLEFGYFYFECAKIRAQEADGYFSHTRPDGRDWHTVFEILDPTYERVIVGENLAWGHEDAYDVMYSDYGWMNSPGHKKNILKPEYKYLAVASVECTEQPGTYATVQLFWG